MPDANDKRCGTCRFADMVITTTDPDFETVPELLCRRYPPAVITMVDRPDEAGRAWVTVEPDEWCGEWQRSPAADAVMDRRRPHLYAGTGPACLGCGRPFADPLPGAEHVDPGAPHDHDPLRGEDDCRWCGEGICYYLHGGCDDQLAPGVYPGQTDVEGEPVHPDDRNDPWRDRGDRPPADG